jgi:Ca-activated chloride channel family protein
MFHFQHIEYLWILAVVPLMILLYFFAIKQKKKTIQKIGDENLVKQLTKNYSSKKFLFKFILAVAAFVFGTFALANLRKPQGSTVINRSGIDVMIALDVSKSMIANDVSPNRLERAKQIVSKIIDKLPDDRIGLVVFAGKAYLQMPLTIDHPAAKMYLSSITTDVVPTQGTVIADALKMCYSAFNASEKKYKSVVLISDGEDHDEGAIKMSKALAGEGIMINTVGIGSPEGSVIKDPETNEDKKDAEGNVVITKLNEDELRTIATNGNGIYQLFDNNTDEIAAMLNGQLKELGQRSLTENSSTNYENYFPWFLAVALLLLIAEFFMSEIKTTVTLKKLRTKTSFIIIFLFLSIVSFAQSENDLIKKGNEVYNKQQYNDAATAYKKAIEKNPSNEAAQYNLGNALYKAGKNEAAEQAYSHAINNSQSTNNRATAWYNKAMAFQNDNKLPESIDAFKQVLRLNPDDEDARQNLQLALQKQKQQQQQKQNKDQQKKQPNNQKQKDNDKDREPKQPQSNISRQDAEEKLKALMQLEKNLQDKLRKVNAATTDKPEKDW